MTSFRVDPAAIAAARGRIAGATDQFNAAIANIDSHIDPLAQSVARLKKEYETLGSFNKALRQSHSELVQQIEAVRGTATSLQAEWQGAGAGSFEGYSTRVNSAANNVNSSLEDLLASSSAIVEALNGVTDDIARANTALEQVNTGEKEVRDVLTDMNKGLSITEQNYAAADAAAQRGFGG